MNIKQAAEFLEMSPRHVLRLIYAEKLAAKKKSHAKVIYVLEWDIEDDSVYDFKLGKEPAICSS